MPTIIQIAGEVLWFFLPALLANLAPVMANHVPWLARFSTPIDGGRTLRHLRVLGDNKTYRGLLMGVLFGSLTALIQYFYQDRLGGVLYPLASPIHAMAWGGMARFRSALR